MRLHFERYFCNHWAPKVIMLHVFKENIRTWTETIEFADLGEKKLPNAKRVLVAPQKHNKTKVSITSQKLGYSNFWQFANSVLNKGKSAIRG